MAQPTWDELIRLAARVIQQPELVPFLEQEAAQDWEQIQKIIVSPFFSFQPFGLYEGRYYGGYEENTALGFPDDNPCQVGFLKDQSVNKWDTAGNRAGKSLVSLMEDAGDCIRIDPVTKLPYRTGREGGKSKAWRFADQKLECWIVVATEDVAIDKTEKSFYRDVLGESESG